MFLAKIKGNKVNFWKLVPFLGRGGSLFTPNRPPRSVSRGSPARKFSKRGVNPNFKSQGGSDPLGPPYGHLCLAGGFYAL